MCFEESTASEEQQSPALDCISGVCVREGAYAAQHINVKVYTQVLRWYRR